MIKKSFGIALIAASVLVMGCSSDDDDATPVVATDAGAVDAGAADATATDGTGEADATATDGTGEADATATDGTGEADATATDGTGEADATATDGTGEADATATDGTGSADGTGSTDGTGGGDGYPAGSLAAAVEADGRASTILAAMVNLGLDLALNDPANNTWTVFLPSNDAIPEGTVLDLATVRKHIYSDANLKAVDLVGIIGTTVQMNDNVTMVTVGGDATALTVDGNGVVQADLEGNTSTAIVHIIDGIIVE